MVCFDLHLFLYTIHKTNLICLLVNIGISPPIELLLCFCLVGQSLAQKVSWMKLALCPLCNRELSHFPSRWSRGPKEADPSVGCICTGFPRSRKLSEGGSLVPTGLCPPLSQLHKCTYVSTVFLINSQASSGANLVLQAGAPP